MNIERLELKSGDVICLPADTDWESAQAFADQLKQTRPELTGLTIVRGNLTSIDEATMNALGWYRQ